LPLRKNDHRCGSSNPTARDGVAEVGQGLVGGQFQLAPDPPGARRGVEATEERCPAIKKTR
jgi:hypothetical protein